MRWAATDTTAVRYERGLPEKAFRKQGEKFAFWMKVADHYKRNHHPMARAYRSISRLDEHTGKTQECELIFYLVVRSGRSLLHPGPLPDASQAFWVLAADARRGDNEATHESFNRLPDARPITKEDHERTLQPESPRQSEQQTNFDNTFNEVFDFRAQECALVMGMQLHGVYIDHETGISFFAPEREYWEYIDTYKQRWAIAQKQAWASSHADHAKFVDEQLAVTLPRGSWRQAIMPNAVQLTSGPVIGRAFVASDFDLGHLVNGSSPLFWLVRKGKRVRWLSDNDNVQGRLHYQHVAFHVAAPAPPRLFRRSELHISASFAADYGSQTTVSVEYAIGQLVHGYRKRKHNL